MRGTRYVSGSRRIGTAFLLFAGVILAVMFLVRASSHAADPRPITLFGTAGTPGAAPSIDLSGTYGAADASIAALPDDGSPVQAVVAGLEFIQLDLTNATVTRDASDFSVAIRGMATGIFELSEPIDVLLLATWTDGGAGAATISIGGYVPHDFDLSLLNERFQYPIGQPEFTEVWFTQSTGAQAGLDEFDGADGFYPPDHEITAGVAFRGELPLAQVIGEDGAELLGYRGGRTVALLGSFDTGVTIYNDKLTVQTDTTLEGRIDVGSVTLFDSVSFSEAGLTIKLKLKTSAPNSQIGGVFDYGVEFSVEGRMLVQKEILGTTLDLDLDMSALFEYSTQSGAAFVTFNAVAAGPWPAPFGLEGFSTDALGITLRFSTEPSASTTKFVITGTFATAKLPGRLFDIALDITVKNSSLTVSTIARLNTGSISVAEALAGFEQLGVPVSLPDSASWDTFKDISLTRFIARLALGEKDVKVFIQAGASVRGFESEVAFYFGPDPDKAGEYGLLFAAHPKSAGNLTLGSIAGSLPAGINDVTLPDAIFWFSTLKFDADRLHYPMPELFDYFNTVWKTSGELNDKITVRAGAGVVSSTDIEGLVPSEVSDFMARTFWVDVQDPVVLAGNIPIFGKQEMSLTARLPRSVPDRTQGGQAPEFFEYAQMFLHIEASAQSVAFSVSGEMGIQLRKPGVPEPQGAEPLNPDNYDHFVLNAAAGIAVKTTPPSVEATLVGQVSAPDGFAPFGLDWLEFSNVSMQLSLKTTPDGNLAVQMGMRTKFAIGQEQPLDLDASIIMSVQTLQVFPWATVKLNGVRIKSDRGLETNDLVALAEMADFWDQPLEITVPPEFPNIAIRNYEIAFADDNYPLLCLTRGFRIKGDLYVNPDPASHEPGPDCDLGSQPEPGESCAGDTPAARAKRDAGCVAGIHLEVTAPGGEAAPGIVGSFAIAAFDIGEAVHFGPAQLELLLTQAATGLTMAGQLTIDGVGSGEGLLTFNAAGIEFQMDAKLFEAFWAHIEVLAPFDLDSPVLQASGFLKTEFGAQFSQAVRGEIEAIRALLLALDTLVGEFESGRSLDELATTIMSLPVTLAQYGAPQSPELAAIGEFINGVNDAIRNAQSSGLSPSVDEVVNNILQGNTIVITEGVRGTYVPSSRTCVGGFVLGECVGVWVNPTCTGVEVGDTCWVIPPVTLQLPGLCGLGAVDFSPYPCSAAGLKQMAADAVKVAFEAVSGMRYEQIRAALRSALSGSVSIPTLFDVQCAAFDIDLGAGSSYDNTLRLGIEVVLLGQRVSTGDLVWDFDEDVLANTGGLVWRLVTNLLTGNPGAPIPGCQVTLPGVPGDTGVPKDLSVTLVPTAANEGEQVALTGSFSEPGVQQGDVRTLTVEWGDGHTDTQTLASGTTAFELSHVYDDDPSGANDARLVTVTVTNSRAGSTTGTAQLTVANVAPVAGPATLSRTATDEGGTVTVTGSFTDAGAGDTHGVTVVWGDGTAPTAATVNQAERTYSATHTYADDDPTATPLDRVTIGITIQDDDGGSAVTGVDLDVANVAPEATVQTIGSTFYEGDVIAITGHITDPGIRDLHRVFVDWSNGVGVPITQDFALVFGQRSFTTTMPLVDDNPTGTPSDATTVIVRVTDDDTGSREYSLPITALNRPPENVAVRLDRPVIVENDTVTATVEWTDAGIADTHTIVIDWGDGTAPTVLTPEATTRQVGASHQYLDDNPTGTSADLYSVTVAVTDDDTGSASAATSIRVMDVPPVLATAGPESGQYSDPLSAPITIHAYDTAGYPGSAESLTISSRWSVDGSPYVAGLPANLSITGGACLPGGEAGSTEPRQTCTWRVGEGTAQTLDVAPGNYRFEFTVTDDDGLASVALYDLRVDPEDARVYYLGPTVAAMILRSDGGADLEIRAVVRDISAEPSSDPDWDPYPGDITNAIVTFIDRTTDQVLCTTPVAPVTPGDSSTGSAACVWSIDAATMALDPGVVTVGSVVGGWYHRDDRADDAEVTVSGPVRGAITAGGFIRPEGSEGRYAVNRGSRATFQIQANFNRNDRRLHGRTSMTFVSGERRFSVETVGVGSFGYAMVDGVLTGQLEALAVMTDVTARNRPEPVAHDLRLQIRIVDARGSRGDMLAFTVWAPDGELLVSSSWTGVTTVAQPIAGGSLQVHMP